MKRDFAPKVKLRRGIVIYKRRRRWWYFGFFVLLVFLGILAFYAYNNVFASETVPKLTGKSLEESKDLTGQEGFGLKISKEFSKYPEGMVISQTPKSGELLNRGGIILLVVSRGTKRTLSEEVSTGAKNPLPAESEKIELEAKKEADDEIFQTKASKWVVCIDPGHQEHANISSEPVGPNSSITKEKCKGGATGINSKTPEYKIVLQMGLKLRDLLEKEGVKVVMIRITNDVDISNAERAQIANKAKANLFVRIHCNGSSNASSNGIMILYPSKNEWCAPIYNESKRAAQFVQQELVGACGRPDKGIVSRGDITGFNWSKVPVILPEICFLSNPEEDALLNKESFQNEVAQGLFKGVMKYLESGA
ncbi:MAG TPA: PASTA domain-containing protein [Actinobacteria bacterium]|nr:PASTA domain-containing protein [Actinomycetota bacterium]